MVCKRFFIVAMALAGLQAVVATARADVLGLAADGIRVDAGRIGGFTLSYPILLKESGDAAAKITQVSLGADNHSETVRYDDGAEVTVTLKEGKGVHLTFSHLPSEVKKYRMEMQLGFSLIQGGKWRMGQDAAKSFPAETPSNPNFYQGNARDLTITDVQGDALHLTVPPYTYQQLTDDRPWRWKNFTYMFIAPLNSAAPTADIDITFGEAKNVTSTAQVDPFGQPVGVAYPGKVTAEKQLKADIPAEKTYYASLAPPARDPFGGLPGSKAKLGLKTTGFFHVEKHGERWILVDPIGNAFFQLGICELGLGDDYTHIQGRESLYAWLPDRNGPFASAYRRDSGDADFSFYVANLVRKYGQPFQEEPYISRMIGRLRKLGFNSGGPFAGKYAAYSPEHFTYAGSLPMGGIPGIPGVSGAWDPFDEENRKRLDRNFAADLSGQADDPLIIGYFLANEPLYEDIPRVIPRLTGTATCKRRLVDDLKAHYRDIGRFNTAWGTSAKSFDELYDMGLPVTTSAAQEDIKTFTAAFLEEYYRLVAETFHKYDQHHMLLGNRFQSGTINNESLCRIAGKYLDIMSFNYYTYGLDKDFLNRIYGWTGRPMILSEYFYDSPATSGLPGGILDMKTQADRGKAYRHYVEQAASLGYVVGTEWFTLVDQSVTGRWFEGYTGERANTGLFSVTDRPYKEALAEMTKTNYGIYDVAFGHRPPFVLADPRFAVSSAATPRTITVYRATGPVPLDGTAVGFPGVPAEQITGKRLVLGSDATGFEAAFKVCRDDRNLYLLINVSDSTPMHNLLQGASIWSADAVEVFIGPEQPDKDGELLPSDRQVLLSAGKVDGKFSSFVVRGGQENACPMIVVPKVDGTGYILEAAIPFAVLGFTPTADQEIRFDIAVDDSADGQRRIRQLVWSGTARDSSDRSGWGRARFVK